MWTYQHESGGVEKLCSEMFRLLIKLHATDGHVLWISPRFFRFVTVIIRGRYLAGWFSGLMFRNFSLRNERIALFVLLFRGSWKLKLNRYLHCLGDWCINSRGACRAHHAVKENGYNVLCIIQYYVEQSYYV